jgi:LPS sulfotransferase NodH
MIDHATKENIVHTLLLAQENKWEAAHEIAQSHEGHADFDRIHALLHRIEGDEWNAKYWYKRSGIPYPYITIDDELALLLEYYSIG